jgi:uncharacterized membrane protein YqjE
MATDPHANRDDGLIGSLRRFGRTLAGTLGTRLEILSTELAEERGHLAKLAMVALTILFCLQVGLMFAVLFFVLAMAPEHRLVAIGLASLVMLLGAGVGALWLRAWLRGRPPMFGTTVTELKKDRDRFAGRRGGLE